MLCSNIDSQMQGDANGVGLTATQVGGSMKIDSSMKQLQLEAVGVFADTNASPGTSTPATAICPEGTTVTGGGYDLVLPSENPTGLVVITNVPSAEENGWFVVIENTSTESVAFQAYAVCTKII